MVPRRDREYSSGSRSQRFRKIQRGIYVESRHAWVNTILGQLALYIYEEGTEIAENTIEPGPTVKVLIPRYKGPTVHWDFSALTLEELTELRKFFDVAFDAAEPVVRMRDKAAADALAEGNDSFSRVYRQVPKLVVRQRAKREHGEGVQYGPEDVLESSGLNGGSSGGVRGPSGELADSGTSEGGSENNGPQAD